MTIQQNPDLKRIKDYPNILPGNLEALEGRRKWRAATTEGRTLQFMPRSCWRYNIISANFSSQSPPCLLSMLWNRETRVSKLDVSKEIVGSKVSEIDGTLSKITEAVIQRRSFDKSESSFRSSSDKLMENGCELSDCKAVETAHETNSQSFLPCYKKY